MSKTPNADDADTDPPTPDPVIAELAATRVEPKGLAACLERFRQVDEDATVIWSANGPRKTHIEELAGVLVEVGGAKRIVIVQVFASGKFKVFADVMLDDFLTV